MYQLTQEELRQLQMVELELLQEADRICKKCNIHYNIIAGTLLGSVRHGGFIPWDDDADIALLRGEYEKFREACQTELDSSKFYFQDHTNTPGYRWGYGKLRRKGTLFLREHQEHMPYEQGVFIDVFPLDSVSDNHFVRTLQNFKLFCYRKIMYAPVGRVSGKNGFQRGIYKFLDKIPEKKLYGSFDKYIDKRKSKKTAWVRILTFPTPNKEYGYKREWYENSKTIVFEGVEFSGIGEAKEYLAFKFGAYMELPPQEKRKVHPVSEFTLKGAKE